MSETVCKYCDSKTKNLIHHHKNTLKCIKLQVEKLGKPLYDFSLKKLENKPSRKPRTIKEKKSSPKKEETEESDIDVQFTDKSDEDNSDIEDVNNDIEDITDDIEDVNNDIEDITDEDDIEDISDEDNKVEPKNKSPIKEKNDIKKSLKHPELMKELSSNYDNKEIESKLTLIINTLNSKDNKVIDEIKKLREELKLRDEEAKQRHENLKKTINKFEKLMSDSNPVSIIEIIKRIQAEIESKDELLQIFKDDLEETCDKYYELYKKLKDIKYDMEDMVYGKK